MRSPIHWFGGKGHMAKHIVPLLPPAHTYAECFGGGASVLFAKPKSPVEVYNDLDSGLVNMFRCLRDPVKARAMKEQLELWPYSREEYSFARDNYQTEPDEVKRAVLFFVLARQSFGGNFAKSFGTDVTHSNRGMSGTVNNWLQGIEGLPQVTKRILAVQIENADFRVILDRYDTPNTLFYCDPPYLAETRRAGEYAHEMTREDHIELLELLKTRKGKVVLSGYPSELYNDLTQNGWERRDFETVCHAVGKTRASGLQGIGKISETQKRTECVWFSPNCADTRQMTFKF